MCMSLMRMRTLWFLNFHYPSNILKYLQNEHTDPLKLLFSCIYSNCFTAMFHLYIVDTATSAKKVKLLTVLFSSHSLLPRLSLTSRQHIIWSRHWIVCTRGFWSKVYQSYNSPKICQRAVFWRYCISVFCVDIYRDLIRQIWLYLAIHSPNN